MPGYAHTVATTTYRFPDLRTLMAKATPPRAGDSLAGIAAASAEELVSTCRRPQPTPPPAKIANPRP